MYILGINTGRNTSAAIVKDGQLLYACEEERFNRKKGTNAFPLESIKFCLHEAGITIKDIDAFTFSFNYRIGINDLLLLAIRYFPMSLEAGLVHVKQWFRSPTFIHLISMHFGLTEREIKQKSHFLEHHLSHSANAYFCSGFKSSAILSIDGSGEIDTMLLSHASGNTINKITSVKFPNSVGFLYNTFTQYLGFDMDEGEGKVMGLSSYGKPIFYKQFQKIIWPQKNGTFKMDMSYFRYHYTANKKKPFYSHKIVELLGQPRKGGDPITERDKDIAASLQLVTEEIGLHAAKYLYNVTQEKHLCISGGVALNSVMNYKILQRAGFHQVYVYPASTDAGTAIGSALYYYYCILGNSKKNVNQSPYLGPQFTNNQIDHALEAQQLQYKRVRDPAGVAAKMISKGKIIGWFQGRSEIGPRALGSRSIVCDPRPVEMKNILNARVKHRESFRPFAPAVKIEKYKEYFNISCPSPYMLFVCNTKRAKRHIIPATLHIDGTARLQTVSKTDHELFWNLLHAFEKLTGIPIVLNTSFNVMGEPIVHTPTDAIICYLKTDLDALVIGNFIIDKGTTALSSIGQTPRR